MADSEFWRVQRRQLASLPEDSANDLLARLVQQRRISPPLLELFRFSATSVSLAGPGITSGWLSYLGEFSALRELSLQRCTKLRGGHLQHLAALSATLQRLDLSGCSGLGDDSAVHLVRLTALQSLNLAGTGLGAAAAGSVAELQQLTSLDMGDLPATDDCCRAVGSRLLQLRHLRLSGTAVGDEGMGDLEQLRHLTSLDLSFTEVRRQRQGRLCGCACKVPFCDVPHEPSGRLLVQVHAPPVVTTLRHLSMARCSLDVADGSPQEAMWLQLGCVCREGQDNRQSHLLAGTQLF